MKTIKFISDDPIQKQFVAVVNKNVNDYFNENKLSQKGDFSMYFKAIVMLSTYIIPFIILLVLPINPGLAILLVIFMGIGEAGIGMSVMHDAAHGAFSRKSWVNNFFSSTIFLLGTNKFNWKIQHNILHHTFTNIFGYDQDIETKAVIRLSPHAPLKKIHKFQYLYAFFFYGLMTLSKLVSDIGQLLEFNTSGITEEQSHNKTKEIIKLIIIKIIYFSVILGLPLYFSSYNWWQILIGFAILHSTAGIIMSTIFQMAHVVESTDQPLPNSDGIIENEWVVHQLKTTSDFAQNNIFLNWYVGGLNFQIEHHLFSNICHIHYRKIAPIVEKTAREFGFTYNVNQTFFDALTSHIKRLKTLVTE